MAKTSAKSKPQPQALPKEAPLVTPGATAGEAAFLILDKDFNKFLAMEPAVKQSDDPEAVHDMRVAARRMRSAVQTFKAFLPPPLVKLQSELQWIFKKLGAVRDLDIEREKLLATQQSSPGKEEAFLDLAQKLSEDRKKARAELKRALQSQRYRELKQELSAAIKKGPSSHNVLAGVPVLVIAPDLVERRYKKARNSGKALTQSSTSPEFHKLRKQAKKFRYTLDFFCDLYDKRGEQMVEHLKKLQDLLGSRQDDVIASNHLKLLVENDGLAKGTRSMAKKLISTYSDEAKQYAHDFGPAFDDVFGKPWKRLRKVMKESRTQLWKG